MKFYWINDACGDCGRYEGGGSGTARNKEKAKICEGLTRKIREQWTELKIIEKTFADRSEYLFYVKNGIRALAVMTRLKFLDE